MQQTGYDKLAEALVFAHGDKACEEALRQQQLNQRTGNMKMAEDWAFIINQMPFCTPSRLHRAA